MIRTSLGVLCAAGMLWAPAFATAQPSAEVSSFVVGDMYHGRRISQIGVIEGDLWLRLEDGALVAVRLDDGRRTMVIDKGVVDIDRRGEQLILLTAKDDVLSVEKIEKGRREAISRVPTSVSGRMRAIYTADGVLAVISHAPVYRGEVERPAPVIQLYDEQLRTWRSVPVSMPGELEERGGQARMRWTYGDLSSALTRDGKAYYVGVDRGEWGGSLYRIDLADGVMRHVALGNDDNVNDVQQDLSRTDCVIVATGLAHMVTYQGSVRRICPEGTSVLISHPLRNGMDLPGTAPVYRLVQLKDGYWFKSQRADFLADAQGADVQPATSQYTELGGLMIDKRHPGLVLVKYDAISSGPDRYYPLAAPR